MNTTVGTPPLDAGVALALLPVATLNCAGHANVGAAYTTTLHVCDDRPPKLSVTVTVYAYVNGYDARLLGGIP